MTRVPHAIAVEPNPPSAAGRDIARALIETTKPRITKLVTITAMVGLVLGLLAAGQAVSAHTLILAAGCLIGTALSAGGANALNQWRELDADTLMARTCERPIPSRRLPAGMVAVFGAAISVVGVMALALTCGPVPALVALVCNVVYVFIYTPMKTATPWNTLVGAIPGALPPLIGTAAASNATGLAALADPLGWSLFALMMVWQLPHFFAIAWMYRDDYARGGFRMLGRDDPEGRRSSLAILLTALVLVPATLTPILAAPDLAGWAYGVTAVVTGIAFVSLCVRFARTRRREHARAVFLASIAHLPVLLIVLVGEAAARTLL